MKTKLSIFVVLIFVAGITSSSFASTMNISNALEFSANEAAAVESPTILSIWNSIYPTIIYSITAKLTSIITPLNVEKQEPLPQQVPEPLTLFLLGSGLIGMYAAAKKLRN